MNSTVIALRPLTALARYLPPDATGTDVVGRIEIGGETHQITVTDVRWACRARREAITRDGDALATQQGHILAEWEWHHHDIYATTACTVCGQDLTASEHETTGTIKRQMTCAEAARIKARIDGEAPHAD